MVIRQGFAQGRPFFYTNLKKAGMRGRLAIKVKKKVFFWNQRISILSPVFIFNTVPTREEIVIENLQHGISCVAVCRVTLVAISSNNKRYHKSLTVQSTILLSISS